MKKILLPLLAGLSFSLYAEELSPEKVAKIFIGIFSLLMAVKFFSIWIPEN